MAQRLAGHFSVDQSATRIRHYRYAEERMMRTMGGWIALTPELSAKLLLGRHVWDCAQHADLLGKRLPELRAAPQVSEPPNPGFVRFVDLLECPDGFGQTAERLVGLYRVLKPHMLAAYRDHLPRTNPVYEPPTRRMLQRLIEEEQRHIAAGAALLAHHLGHAEARLRAGAWEEQLVGLLAEAGGVTGEGLSPLRALDVPPDPESVAGDLVEFEKAAEPWPLPAALRVAVEAHTERLVRRDLAGLGSDLAEEAREGGLAVLRAALAPRLDRPQVVAVAKVGAQRQVKIRLSGAGGAVVLLSRWGEEDGSWRVLEVEVVRTESPASSAPPGHP